MDSFVVYSPGSLPEPAELTGIARFELVRSIGSGAMGTVFEARDRRTGQRLAIKALHDGAGSILYQFKHEFRVLSELSHPFLVRFGELFEDAGRFYLTMELVEGESFFDYVRPHDVLDEERLRRALGQLASALVALHASGVIHRDIKPQNVLVNGSGRVVLLDFGIAIGEEDRGVRPELAGTVDYMAPELLSGQPITEAADWYAVGVVLYQALTGGLPFAGTPPWAAARRSQPWHPQRVSRDVELPADLCATCMDLLEPDPQRRLGAEAIARRLGLDVQVERARASFRAQLHFSRTVFVSRTRELDVLRDALERTRRGGSEVVRVVGESGVGKTALLRRWLAEVGREADGALVLSSRCYERETLPYGGVDGMIDALVRHLREAQYGQHAMALPGDAALLGHVFPVLRAFPEFEGVPASGLLRDDPQEARRLAFAALRDLLAGLAEHRPVVIHVDDAQWIDSESVALLSFLVSGDAPSRMLLVFTERPTATSASGAIARTSRVGTTLELGPLPPGDSELLASELLRRMGRGTDLLPAMVARTSGGHPLFIHELVLYDAPDAREGRSLEAALSARISRLSPACRRLLEIVAIASSPVAHEVARGAAGLEPAEYPQVISTLRSENLASFRGLAERDDVQIYHDRIRELVVDAMDAAMRRERHLHLATSMETGAPDAAEALANHFYEADVRDKAARYARGAAEGALKKLAFEHAARFFQLALRAENVPHERAHLEERLGQALADAGRGAHAAEAYLRASSLLDGTAAKELRRRAGEQLLRAGHVERGIVILSEILRELGVRIPRTDLATTSSLAGALLRLEVRLMRRGLRFEARPASELTPEQRLRMDACWTMATGLSMVHHLRATDFQARSLLMALELGARDRVLRAAALLGVSISADPIARRIGRRLMDGARELARASPTPETQAWLSLTRGAAAMGDWDFATCVEACRQAEVDFRTRCTGAAWEVVSSQAFMLWSMAFQGELKAAGERLPALLSSARARGDRHALATLALSPLHLVGLAANEPARVRAECTEIAGEWPEDWACFQHMCAAYVLAQVELYEGNAHSAWTRAMRAWRMLRRSHLSRVQFQRVDLLGLRARAALACASAETSEQSTWLTRARADAALLDGVGIDAAQGMASLVEATAACAEGRRDHASHQLEHAAIRFAARGMRLHAAVSRVALGRVRDDGRLRDDATRELVALGVVDVAKMTRLWLPGRWIH
ncbi:MAG TPA: protein kinase [Polyangiaceae bacterium]|nr:protein kinase [Polyangiaceae bacterium]